MKITLWTIQDERGLNELQSQGILVPKEKFVYEDFTIGYDWMKTQMCKRIRLPQNEYQYPIGAWYQYGDENRKRPDLRRSGFLPKGSTGYRIEIEKDPQHALLSDFELWHYPLSYQSYIANSEYESLEFERALIADFGTDSFAELPAKVQKKIERSWEKIFDLYFEVPYYTRPLKDKSIQATFWELRLDEVIKVDSFKAR